MMLILLATNIIFAIALCVINVAYVYSFEVAFIGTLGAIYSSYKSISRKIDIATQEYFKEDSNISTQKNIAMQKDSTIPTPESIDKREDFVDSNLSKKDRFVIGAKISFGILRIISYGFIAIGCVALINNKIFFIIPFLLGVLVASVSSAIAMALKSH